MTAGPLGKIGTQAAALSGPIAPLASTLTISSGTWFALNTFIATAQSVDTLLWLLYVSLTVAGVAVLLLAAQMVVMRRSAEITVIRARGGSLWQIAVGTGRDAALLCVPAAVIAAVLAILVVPVAGSALGAGAAGDWWPPLSRWWPPRSWVPPSSRPGSIVCPAAGPPSPVASGPRPAGHGDGAGGRVGGGHRRLPRSGRTSRLGREPPHQLRADTGDHPSGDRGAPAVPAGAARIAARLRAQLPRARVPRPRPGVPDRRPPAIALVLALTVAAFAGMVRDAVINGEVAASWHTAGADAMVTSSYTAQSFTILPAADRAVAAVPA